MPCWPTRRRSPATSSSAATAHSNAADMYFLLPDAVMTNVTNSSEQIVTATMPRRVRVCALLRCANLAAEFRKLKRIAIGCGAEVDNKHFKN
jgi:hypothetical protein